MKRCRRLLSRLILLSFALRALVPMGLMLQLPIASANEGSHSESASAKANSTPSFGFVICPVQNPGIDLNLLSDRGQPNAQHAHHHNHHADQSAEKASQDHNTVSVDRGASLCHLWSSSENASLLATKYSNIEVPAGLQPPASPAVAVYQSNHFPSRLIRAPPHNL